MVPKARESLGFLRACKRASVAEEEQRGPGGRVSRALQGLRAKLPLENSLNVQIGSKQKIKISQGPRCSISFWVSCLGCAGAE